MAIERQLLITGTETMETITGAVTNTFITLLTETVEINRCSQTLSRYTHRNYITGVSQTFQIFCYLKMLLDLQSVSTNVLQTLIVQVQ